MTRRGRPVLGAIMGLLFGVFVALDLAFFGVRPLDSFSVIGLPLIGLALGLGLAYWAPFGRKRAVADAASPTPGPRPAGPSGPPPEDAA